MTEQDLLIRAHAIAGLSVAELARQLSIEPPIDLRRAKGWTGMLIETALGCSAGPTPIQDFPELGIELKTLPINHAGKVLETTYVCYCDVNPPYAKHFAESNVFNKLQRVLWIPIVAERDLDLQDRTVATGFIWCPSSQQNAMLERDWANIMEQISSGMVDTVSSRLGDYLHVRPKAANGQATVATTNQNGESIHTRPRGFYLRKSFTQWILDDQIML